MKILTSTTPFLLGRERLWIGCAAWASGVGTSLALRSALDLDIGPFVVGINALAWTVALGLYERRVLSREALVPPQD